MLQLKPFIYTCGSYHTFYKNFRGGGKLAWYYKNM